MVALDDVDDLVVVGKITTVYGVKGWVKVHSYTEPMENLLAYPRCYLQRDKRWEPLVFAAVKRHGSGLIAQIESVNDRDQARAYCQCAIAIPAAALPETEDDEFYWHQLQGLQVFTDRPDNGQLLLGKVHHMMETGANDVMVVQGERERLIPYVMDEVVKKIDLDNRQITVAWDSEF